MITGDDNFTTANAALAKHPLYWIEIEGVEIAFAAFKVSDLPVPPAPGYGVQGYGLVGYGF